MAERITLYTAKVCPYAHRVELALNEADLDFQRYEIDLGNKPEWYVTKVNPASKVPAIAYGGPDVDPSEPSPESTKLAESYVLLEFIADLASTTSKPLLPTSPVARARARFFAETVISKFTPAFYAALTRGEDPAVLLPAFDSIVELLPKKGGFAVGDQWSIGDAAVVPFIARALVVLERDIDAYKEGQGRKVREILDTDAKYERFRRYYQDNSERPSFKKTWDESVIVDQYGKRFGKVQKGENASS